MPGSRPGKVIDVNAAWKWMDVVVQMLLGFVEAAAAGEDHTGASQKRAFSLAQTGRSTGKVREFIHAVIHHRRRFQMVAETKRHRRVIPQHLGTDVLLRDQFIKEMPLHVGLALTIRFAQMGHDDTNPCLCLGDRQVRAVDCVEDWFLNDEDAPVTGATAQQMLRTLEHEVPSQMGKAKDVAAHAREVSKNYAGGTSTRA